MNVMGWERVDIPSPYFTMDAQTRWGRSRPPGAWRYQSLGYPRRRYRFFCI
jgi:hypothetical protein